MFFKISTKYENICEIESTNKFQIISVMLLTALDAANTTAPGATSSSNSIVTVASFPSRASYHIIFVRFYILLYFHPDICIMLISNG